MTTEQENKWREDFEEEFLRGGYSENHHLFRAELNPHEYEQQTIQSKWLWYLSALKKAQEEIDEITQAAIAAIVKIDDSHKREITQLKEELKREREAVDFYANKDHWEKFTEGYSEYNFESGTMCAMDCIIEYDVESFDRKLLRDRDHSIGGLHARKTQQQRRIEL